MTAAVRLIQWTVKREVFGPDHPAARAAFGRYVAAKGGWLTRASGCDVSYVAWRREASGRGFRNRRAREEYPASWAL